MTKFQEPKLSEEQKELIAKLYPKDKIQILTGIDKEKQKYVSGIFHIEDKEKNPIAVYEHTMNPALIEIELHDFCKKIEIEFNNIKDE